MKINGKSLFFGILSGAGILIFYISVLTFFQSYGFAISEFKRLWVWLIPLAIGFGTQIGIYISIKHDATINRGAATSGTISGGSMVVCCSHFLISVIPLIGITGLSVLTSFLMTYQKAFFSIGIASSVMGITLMLYHKRKMKAPQERRFIHSLSLELNQMKGGSD